MTIARYDVQCYNQEFNSWFSDAITRPCILWRSLASHCYPNKQENAGMCRDMRSSLSFVNEAQFLLISEASVTELNNRLKSSKHLNHSILCQPLSSYAEFVLVCSVTECLCYRIISNSGSTNRSGSANEISSEPCHIRRQAI